MSKEKRRVPKLRFPGFTEDWEQRKLESLFTKYEDKVNTPNSGYWRLGLRSHCKGTFHTYIDAGNELETAEMNRVKSGNFILNITFAWERALAVTNDEDQDKLVSHRFPQFKPNSDLVIDFFKHTLMDKRFKHHLELSSPGGAGRNKVLKVADMLKYELLVPSIKEQNEISSLLNHVDYIITLHQRKLDNLKLKKKALLQKLFPKNGEHYPELRFPGFTDAWEQREFSDIFSEVKSGLSRMLSNDDIGLPVVRANNINDGQLNLVDDIKYWYKNDPQGANTNNYLIEQGDILINFINSEAKMGTAAYVTRRPERDTIYTTNILRCKVNDEYNPYFIYSLTFLNSYKNYIASITKPAVNQASFTTVDFKKYSIKIPTVKEQNQIADLIETFNKLITLHQRKLDHLQLQKKALLQQMFV